MKKYDKYIGVNIPPNWELVRLGDVAISEKGKKPNHLSFRKTREHNIPYIDIKAFEQNEITKWTDGEGCVFCKDNDVLMVWDGSRSGLVGRAIPGAIGSTIAKIYIPLICKTYLYYFLYIKYEDINAQVKGNGIPHVNPQLLWDYLFPLPPLPEQHRIVAKVEQHFSKLDKGMVELKKAKEKLELYRQSLLKAAFEGRLTEQWRKEHADELESAEELLARIKAEREKRYQQQLEEWKQAVKKWEANGKPGKKPTKPRKPKELPPLTEEELAELPELPEGWMWVKLDEIGKLYSGQSPKTTDVNTQGKGIPYVTGPEQWDGATVGLNKWTTNPKQVVPEGCIFITVKGAGVGKLFPGVKSAIGRDISAYCPCKYIVFDFMLLALKHTIAQITSKALGDIPGLSRNHILEHVVAMPSFSEQQKMAESLRNSFSLIDYLSRNIDQALARAESLRQSILKKAFSGKLVPQDPNDEPASELLKRIRAEREKAAEKKKPARKARKKKEGKRVRDLLATLTLAGDWISAQEAFRQCGISDGAETDQIEPIYMELRDLVNSGKVIVERRGEEDWLKLKDIRRA